jgi:hypothetical protein
MFDVNSTAQLLGAFGVLDRPSSFIKKLFMQFEQTFDTSEVYFDQVQRARQMAAFTAPTTVGKVMRSRGYATQSFTPAYVKPKHIVEPLKAMKRRAGERLPGEMSPEQRYALAILDNMMLEDDAITRREIWMIMQLLLTGTVTCSGDDYPSTVLNLNRNSGNTVQLTGSLRWGQAGVDPLQNIRAWSTLVQQVSGYKPRTVILDPLAGDLLIQSPTILKVMQSFRQTTGNIDLAGKTTGGAIGEEVAYLGSLPEFDFWQYQELWTDDTGTVQQFMPNNTVILASPGGAQGIMAYGAIMDKRAGLRPLPRFPKVFDTEEPSQTSTMTQSAPLPLFGWINATFAATVA